MKIGSNWSPRLALFGDLGNANSQSLPFLQEETINNHFDAILHVGDFAYNMDTVIQVYFLIQILYFN
jgi:acid phosphatase type 7